MRTFRAALAERNPDPAGRRWIYAAYDQLGELGPLAAEDPRSLGLVLIETPAKAARRPYHQQKLAYVLANSRHFALEQAARGVAVRYEVARDGYAPRLRALARELGPLRTMAPAERELRVELAPLFEDGSLLCVPHAGWLTTAEDFARACPKVPWRMEAFYRHVRGRTGILMEGGQPVGGAYSFDKENRQPWRGTPAPVPPPRFTPDAVTREVGALIEARYGHHPGRLDLEALPATRADALAVWAWAKSACLPHFGPFEDVFSHRSRTLFHTRISPLLNLHRLLPEEVVNDVLALDLPLPSKEGFVRQVLGWREFVRHVHVATDGFRRLPPHRAVPPDPPLDARGQAAPSFLGAQGALPATFWPGAPSGLACLDDTVRAVWEDGYSHHITRLMVLSNIATLLDVSPRALTDWFWEAYTDAYDWVVEPNVLGMGTFALGELMTTKPYVAGSAYLDRMGDLCGPCAFQPGQDCPITPLYWAFLGRHAPALRSNPRVSGPVAGALKRAPAQQAADAAVFTYVRDTLARGEVVTPDGVRAARVAAEGAPTGALLGRKSEGGGA
jgi:deoxyribodipyrimidine photolyase-related protein